MELEIENFKCFIKKSIPLNKLTVFAGTNGSGKSTAVQALLIFRAVLEKVRFGIIEIQNKNNSTIRVPLNGLYCLQLGDTEKIICKNNINPLDSIIIRIKNSEENFSEVRFKALEDEPQLAITVDDFKFETNVKNNPFLSFQFHYLNAERIGPRIKQEVVYYDYPQAGFQGENTAELIANNEYLKIYSNRLFPSNSITSKYFKDQINLWLDYIMPGIQIKTKSFTEVNSAQILLENSYTVGNAVIATNIGFGISYVLPIIASALIAEKGSVLIVENPEAHLHPSAQSRIGRFLAYMSSAGLTVIIETHSDHVINGIQIAVAEKKVKSSDVSINYFSTRKEEIQPIMDLISLTEKGELSKWPSGFFDQSQIDFSELMKFRKQ